MICLLIGRSYFVGFMLLQNNLGPFSHILLITVLFQSLRDKQKSVRENQAPNMKQMKMWSVSSFF